MGTKHTKGENGAKDTYEPAEQRVVHLSPVTSGSPENETFYAYTPAGKIDLGTLNPDAWAGFELNKEYYVDFTAAEPTN